MSAVENIPLSQSLRNVGDPAIISKRIAPSSPRLATPHSPTSSSTTFSKADEIDESSFSSRSELDPVATRPPEPDILKTIPKTQKIIDMDTFRQILDLDEEGDHEFSLSMVAEYFNQAEETFRKLDRSFKDANLSELSGLGHFLKGSSAAFGLVQVQASCEKIQHYGLKRDEEAKKDLTPQDALGRIQNQLEQLKQEYAEAKQTLEDWYREHQHEDCGRLT